MSIAGLQVQLIEAAIRANVPVSGGRTQFAVDRIEGFGSVSAMQVHLAFEAANFDFSIFSSQVDLALARHMNVDVDATLAPVDGEAVHARIVHINLNAAPVLWSRVFVACGA